MGCAGRVNGYFLLTFSFTSYQHFCSDRYHFRFKISLSGWNSVSRLSLGFSLRMVRTPLRLMIRSHAVTEIRYILRFILPLHITLIQFQFFMTEIRAIWFPFLTTVWRWTIFVVFCIQGCFKNYQLSNCLLWSLAGSQMTRAVTNNSAFSPRISTLFF